MKTNNGEKVGEVLALQDILTTKHDLKLLKINDVEMYIIIRYSKYLQSNLNNLVSQLDTFDGVKNSFL